MIVEAAMGHVGRLHQVSDADPVEPFFAKQNRSFFNHARFILIGLLFGDPHGAPGLTLEL